MFCFNIQCIARKIKLFIGLLVSTEHPETCNMVQIKKLGQNSPGTKGVMKSRGKRKEMTQASILNALFCWIMLFFFFLWGKTAHWWAAISEVWPLKYITDIRICLCTISFRAVIHSWLPLWWSNHDNKNLTPKKISVEQMIPEQYLNNFKTADVLQKSLWLLV